MDVTDEPDDVLIKVQNKQRKDEELMKILTYLQDKILPNDSKQAMHASIQFGQERLLHC